MRKLSLCLVVLISACSVEETVFSYGAGERTWRLTSFNGAPFPADVTLLFPRPGQIAGRAPCNFYSGAQLLPYPWFEVGPLRVTRRACPDLAAEAQYLDALSRMELSRVEGDTLILSIWEGDEMVFTLQPDG